MATSLPAKEKSGKRSVIHQLSDLFGSVLNMQIIESVAHTCNYNVEMSSHHLLEMTSSIDESPAMNGETEQKPNTATHTTPVASLAQTIPNSASDGYLSQNLNPKQLNATIPPQLQGSKNMKELEKVITAISQGYRILILLRGLPGSGKSHLGRFIIDATLGRGKYEDHIFSTDDYFYKNNQYVFDGKKISEAHDWNHNRAFKAMSHGVSPVIIDNTNTKMWEMKPYAMMAIDYGYYVEILEPNTPWCFSVDQLAKKNKHGVPKQSINDMLLRYQKNITGYELLCAYNLHYSRNKPPMFRNQPPLTYGSNWLSCSNLTYNGNDNWNNPTVSSAFSSSSPEIDQVPETTENINLMDFNDEKTNASEPVIISDDEDDVRIVDGILTCSPLGENSILKPNQLNNSSGASLNKQSEKSVPDIESAWGINEKTLHSWDIVMPVIEEERKSLQKPEAETVPPVETRDYGTLTEEVDFQLYKQDVLSHGYKVIKAYNRDININTPVRNYHSVPKKLMLHKSCLAVHVDVEMDDSSKHMANLEALFPRIPKKYLKEIYQKCQGDLNWTIDLLLEGAKTISDSEDEEDDDDTQNTIQEVVPENHSTQESTLYVSQNGTHCKKKFNTLTKAAEELKKAIESKIHIGNDHYSERVLKIKQRQRNDKSESTSISPPIHDAYDTYNAIPSTSNQATLSEEILTTDDSDSDIDFDSSSDKTDFEEIIELNLGDTLVSQLEDRFGCEMPGFPKGFQPIIQVPTSLAKQLFALYLESAYQQMESQTKVLETLVKQDEEFAKQLDEQERKNSEQEKETVLSFQEVMDEQVAFNLYQEDINQWKNLTPDTLALKMTKQKLFSSFPTIDQAAIVEVLHAHDNDYSQTVETLLHSAHPQSINGTVTDIKTPPISEETVKEMEEDVRKCNVKERNEKQSAVEYREEAQNYLQKRNELHQKAENYFQQRMFQVAQFYSDLARKQLSLYERTNSMAVTSFVEEHSNRLQAFDTLDLHFLFAKEAIPALDVFIDRNIHLLKNDNGKSSHQDLIIITGRGKHSENGKSKLKPIVISRLKKRKLNYVQLNPGALKLKITKNSLVTSEVP